LLPKIVFGSGLDIYWNNYGFAPLTYLSAFAGIFCVIIISYNTNIKSIEYIGRNSLIYFAWHQTIMIPIINKVYWVTNIYKYKALSLPLEILSFLMICITLTIADYIIRNTKLCFMLGVKPHTNIS
jgi:fucose 4-O-acetylase-like acetyltransferase